MGDEGESTSADESVRRKRFGESSPVVNAETTAFRQVVSRDIRPQQPDFLDIMLSDDLDDESLIDESSLSLSLDRNMSTEDMILMDDDMMNSSFADKRALSPLLPSPPALDNRRSPDPIPLRKSVSTPHPVLATNGRQPEVPSMSPFVTPTATPTMPESDRAVSIHEGAGSLRPSTDEPSPPLPFRKVMSTSAVPSRSSHGSRKSYGWMSHSPFQRRSSAEMRPLAGGLRDSRPSAMLKRLQFDGNESDNSSHGSLTSRFSTVADQEMEQLARQLATPTKRADRKSSLRSNMTPSNIFRSVRIGTPTMSMFGSSFRSSNATGSGEDTPTIGRNDTMVTTKSDEEGDMELSSSSGTSRRRRRMSSRRERNLEADLTAVSGEVNASILSSPGSGPSMGIFGHRETFLHVAYLSTFATFGAVFRVYVGRFFGLDCEKYPGGVHDFLTPLSKHICVTSSGGTEQIGGSTFVDLPANIIGCFILGLFTNLRPDLWPPLPWLHADHPLQRNRPLHVAIQTGLCGSLTTFASWNSQMIFMMDGSKTELGSQILPAIFGYLIGLSAAIWSFTFGTQVSSWLNRWKRPDTIAMTDPTSHSRLDEPSLGGESNSTNSNQQVDSKPAPVPPPQRPDPRIISCPTFFDGSSIPFLILSLLVAAFVAGDVLMDIPFYRAMWANAILAPPGALLRWQLARSLNGGNVVRGRFHWIPWGTLTANVIASMISAGLLGVVKLNEVDEWHDKVFIALRVGFAGSLSTVSTFVKEIYDLQHSHPHHAKPYIYAGMTIISACLLSLSIYSPIVHFGG